MARARQTRFSDFRVGWDTREGVFIDGNAPIRWKTFENVVVGTNRRMRRRWPVKKVDVTIPDEIQGCFLYRGRQTVIRRSGSTATLTGTDAGDFDVIDFDVPPMCGDAWELLDVCTVGDVICAVCRHQINNPTYGTTGVVYLHLWDEYSRNGSRSTWVDDPYVPTNLLDGWQTGASAGNTFKDDYAPRLCAVGSRLAMSRPDGNVSLSKLNNPRVWNTLEAADLEEVWPVPFYSSTAENSFLLPFRYDDLVWTGGANYRFYAYTVQYYSDSDAQWLSIASPTYYSIAKDATTGRARITFSSQPYSVMRFCVTRVSRQEGNGGVYNDRTLIAGVSETQWLDTAGTSDTITIEGKELTLNRSAYDPGFLALKATATSYPPANDYTLWTFQLDPTTDNLIRPRLAPAQNTNWGFIDQHVGYNDPADFGTEWRKSAVDASADWIGGQARWEAYDYTAGRPFMIWPWMFYDDKINGELVPYLQPDQDWHDTWFFNEVEFAGGTSSAILAAGSSTNTDRGEGVQAMAAIRDSLLVLYPGTCQVYYVPANLDQIRFLDSSPFGCGEAGFTEAIQFDAGLLMAPAVNGWRAWDIDGDAVVSLQDKNIGEPLDLTNIGVFTPRAAGYWPHQGCYITLGEHDGEYAGVCFRFSRESQIAAWSRITFSADQRPFWRNATETAPGSFKLNRGMMYALDDRMVWRAGNTVKYFDALEAVNLRDENESVGAGYVASLRSHALRLDPDILKRFQFIDVDQTGDLTLTVNLDPENLGEILNGPTIEGMTYTNRKVGLPYQFYAVELLITSPTETLHEIREISLVWNPLKRFSGS